MAPEQAGGRNEEVGPLADVYALGAILYECLTGRPPFKATSVLETLEQVKHQEPVPPRHFHTRLPRDIETICLKCLQKEPRKRYASAQQLADDLRDFQAGKPIQARPTPAWERTLKWAKRRPAVAALLALIPVALLTALAALVWHTQVLNNRLEQARRGQLREQTKAHLSVGNALSATDSPDQWKEAQLRFKQATGMIEQEPFLAGLLDNAQQQTLAENTRRLSEIDKTKQATAQVEQFQKWREEALFYSSQATGQDTYPNVEAMRSAARNGLALFKMHTATSVEPDWDGLLFSPSQKQEIRDGCYELLLTLADAEARPLPGSKPPHERAGKALRHLDVALKLRGPTRAYHLALAECLAPADWLGAEWEREQAKHLEPTTPIDHFLVGYQYYRVDPGKAIQAFENALDRQPDHFWAQYWLAVCHVRDGHPDRAKPGLNACVSRRPDLVWTYLLRGLVHGELQEFPAAEADLTRAQVLIDKQDLLDKAGGRSVDVNARYVLLMNRGVVLFRQKQWGPAIDAFREAGELKPDAFTAHANLALAYKANEQLELALWEFAAAIKCEPRQAFLYRNRARLYMDNHEWAKAQADLTSALHLATDPIPEGQALPAGHPDRRALADDYTRLGHFRYHRKDYEAAAQAYETALQVWRGHPEAPFWHAAALSKLSEGDRIRRVEPETERRARRALESLNAYLARGAPRAWAYEAYELRARLRTQLDDHAGAVVDYTLALELPQSPAGRWFAPYLPRDGAQRRAATLASRGWSYLALDAPKLALPDFVAAVDLDHDNADAYSGRGFALVKVGDYRLAVKDAETAYRLGSEDPRTLGSEDPRTLYKVARIFAQAVARVETDRDRLKYQDRALELLQKALPALDRQSAEGNADPWSDLVRKDPALDPIRGSTGYRELEKWYSKPLRGQPR
jgi:tetratricopeptide (TPR) repeat protein